MITAMTDSYREVLSWLRGGDMTPDPEMEDRFIDVIASMVQQRLESSENEKRAAEAARRQERRTSPGSKLSIRAIVDDMRAKGECDFTYEELMGIKPKDTAEVPVGTSEAPEEPKVWQELDSYALAMALRYIGRCAGHLLNMSQIQIILYISYGVWLARRGERLTAEHPQVWQFGPVFPRAYNRCRKDNGTGQDEYMDLLETNPEVVKFLEERFRRYAWVPAKSLTEPHTVKGTPWDDARLASPDKWGAAMSDDNIRTWFSSRLAPSSGQ